MEIVFFGEKQNAIERVYSLGRKEQILGLGDCIPEIIGRHNFTQFKQALKDVKYAFSTWGMPCFSVQEIKEYFPSLKCLFYSAGTVKNFGRNFLECGVRVFSSRFSNSIPVVETVFAQIILANKGFYHYLYEKSYEKKKEICNKQIGNFNSTVGVIGVGMIGKLLIEKLKTLSINVIVWDKFLSDEQANELGVKKVSLEELFSQSDVITNHLADKEETFNILNYNLFSKMKKTATFINSGRGRQVNENDLILALKEQKGRFAILDVTYPEPPSLDSELLSLENVILTPHIDGSLGNEVVRMADEMIETYIAVLENKPCNNEIFIEMLDTMA